MTIENRYEFVLLFDVKDGNPNGDPDAGNLPRVDPNTNQGLVTDVCLKRKVRNYVEITYENKPGFEIYVKEASVLNLQNMRAYNANPTIEVLDYSKGAKTPKGKEDITSWMCNNFFDIRTFGAVMSTGVNAGQVRGPVQLVFSRSVDPIIPLEHSITRMAVTKEEDVEKERTIGRKHTVSYGLYRCHGFISPHFAKKTNFTNADLDVFFDALLSMFDHDHSASRGEMTTRGLYVFKHQSALGNAPAHELLEKIQVRKRNVDIPSGFQDYEVSIVDTLPDGVSLIRYRG